MKGTLRVKKPDNSGKGEETTFSKFIFSDRVAVVHYLLKK